MIALSPAQKTLALAALLSLGHLSCGNEAIVGDTAQLPETGRHPLFDTFVGIGVSYPPRDLVSADFDGRLGPDLAVAGSGPIATVLLNRGDGTFVASEIQQSGLAIDTGDFDGDSYPDLVFADLDIHVYLNNRDGTFRPGPVVRLGAAISILAVDLDGTGGPDVITVPQQIGDISVRLNTGTGTFHDAVFYNAGNAPWDVASGDLDGANGPDLVVADNRFSDVWVLSNAGDGTFAPTASYPVGERPVAVAVSDLDGAGGPDVIAVNVSSEDISVLLNNGDGTLQAAVDYGVGRRPRAVITADIDGVNGPDLAVTNTESNDVSAAPSTSTCAGTTEFP